MKNPRGYTWPDIFWSLAVVVFLSLAIALAMNPWRILGKENDEVRINDVRNLMEVMLEMQQVDSEAFAQVVGPAASGRTMIGSAQNCAGSYGPRCSDELLSDHCINLADFAVPKYLSELPVDTAGKDFSPAKTGYYISFESGELEIGACNPQSQHDIVLSKNFY